MSNRDNIEITLITENDRERMEQVAQMETDVFPDPWSYHEVRSTVRQKHTFCAAKQWKGIPCWDIFYVIMFWMNARLQELQLLNLKDAEELDRCCLDLWNRSAMKSN